MSNDSENLNDILDETLDDLADLPESKPFPAGAHAVRFSLTHDDKKSTLFIAKFKYREVLELSSPTDEPPKVGDEAVMFVHTKKKDGTPNEFGQGQLKQLLSPFVDAAGSNKVGDLLNYLKNGVDAAIVSGVKKQKDYADSMTLSSIKAM